MQAQTSGPRWAARVAVVASLSWLVGCFDSDEVFKIAPTATSGEPDTTSASTTVTTFPQNGDDDTTGEPMGDKTCIDAIDCVRGCIIELASTNVPEPDLSCFLDCTKELSEQEALKLLRLGNCVSDQCVVAGKCMGPSDDDTGEGESSTGEGESSTGEGESSTGAGESGSSTGDEPGDEDGGNGAGNGSADDGLIDDCLLCILNGMLDPEPQGCVDLAESCRKKE